jgi:hypothetical protein
MYKTLVVPAADNNTAAKEVKKLFKQLGLELWQVKNFSPVHDKETEFLPGTPQYKTIVLLTADQVERLEQKPPADQDKKPADQAKESAAKKPADQAKKPAAKKPAAKKPAALAKKPTVKTSKPGK